ncbi:CX3C chemokine receptor 1 isoform X1 [Sceloporus undulatus]|uniref:CX3C chemokine receptor 1 isoform X1 n=1 Tax=Sceloporus undulatus TaxID=8520 RepID=UPI001C4AFA3E|nr:CX3C chemokine receptor 1 isoform X1 [Sceloporus undulatus]XP_042331513.1 CX3C chemokine receptor 1 isoform X1 [Sceloporus undulatus]
MMAGENTIVSTTEFVYEDVASPCDKGDIQILGKLFLPILYAVVFTIGLVGNFLVIFTIVRSGHQKSITDIFLLNLAISDLLFVISLPFWASYIIHEWTLGNLSCQIVSSFYTVGFFGGLFFITVISIDRYLAIVHATYVMKARTVPRGCLTSIAVWALAVLFAAPHFVFIQKSENKCTSVYPEHLEKIWPAFSYMEINVIGFLLPMCIISFCYLSIIKTLLSCKNNRKKRAVKLILTVVIVFFLFWTPYHVSLFLQILRFYDFFETCTSLRLLEYIMHVTEPLAFSHCCLNPIIYAFASEKFRKYLSHFVLKCLSFVGFCGPCNKYRGTAPIPVPETALTSNQTQNSSYQDGSVLL